MGDGCSHGQRFHCVLPEGGFKALGDDGYGPYVETDGDKGADFLFNFGTLFPPGVGAIRGVLAIRAIQAAKVGPAAKSVDALANIPFRPNTSHIFRNKTGHLLEDTADNRALIQSALSPGNQRRTDTLPDGTSIARYFRELPDGTQAWAEVRNGTQITNGGLNVIPR